MTFREKGTVSVENIKGEYRNEIGSILTINEDNVDDVLAELMFDDPKVPWKEAGKALKTLVDRLQHDKNGAKP